jgi:hypothetical protein
MRVKIEGGKKGFQELPLPQKMSVLLKPLVAGWIFALATARSEEYSLGPVPKVVHRRVPMGLILAERVAVPSAIPDAPLLREAVNHGIVMPH